jgi:glycopeptide antibiotics resistance protein
MRWLTRHAKALLVLNGAFLVFALLFPTSGVQSGGVSWLRRLLGTLGAPDAVANQMRLEFAMNAVIIAPVVFLGALLLPRYTWRDWTAIGFSGAMLVEMTQGMLMPGRSATFVDVVANTLGALLGAGCAALAQWRSRQFTP